VTEHITRWQVPAAIRTNGVGSVGNTAHLNLTRSLADVWGVEDPVPPDPNAQYRLRTKSGHYLHLSAQSFTSEPESAWCGNKSQLDKVRGALELARGLKVEVVPA
jgi:hypothetical protein